MKHFSDHEASSRHANQTPHNVSAKHSIGQVSLDEHCSLITSFVVCWRAGVQLSC